MKTTVSEVKANVLYTLVEDYKKKVPYKDIAKKLSATIPGANIAWVKNKMAMLRKAGKIKKEPGWIQTAKLLKV